MKNIFTYPALLYFDIPGEIGFTFPDFPGCTGQCFEDKDIWEYAQETLEFHLEGIIEDGEILPKPTKIRNLNLDGAKAVIPVRVLIDNKNLVAV